jgi:hypothetical protein
VGTFLKLLSVPVFQATHFERGFAAFEGFPNEFPNILRVNRTEIPVRQVHF